ncbi:MAG: ribose-phosphate pyrophosphokinae [Moraxellaceae bacterium]|jgi:ribose-phosphate pyrophosphokinase|nr:ribose-phosphate pyrophosphokinae [Moraxellaceae bacterium]
MSAPLLLVYPGNETLADALVAQLACDVAALALHHFPDGETLVTLPAVKDREVLLLCSLDRPDAKLAPLLFAADAARDLGATRVGLIAPYLAYMRQDRRFHPGEAVTSRSFAGVISHHFDFLATVDPHLHRYHDLAEIYSIPARAVSSAAAIAAWIRREVKQPLLVGPDEESAQWIEAVAALEGLPHTVLTKTRHDDFNVEVSLPDAGRWAGLTPVLVDDIVSSAHTMIAAAGSLKKMGLAAPVCVGVHALFGGTAYAELKAAGAARIATCNCVPHDSNAIDVMPALADGLAALLKTA